MSSLRESLIYWCKISNAMFIYASQHASFLPERLRMAETILQQIPAKYCFITGSFLYNKTYKDIDVFVLSRSKKKFSHNNPKMNITIIDFNDLYSLFFHSITKSCVAKNILPQRPLKITLSDYWNVINEAVPTLLNQHDTYHKDVRFLLLYTEYFKSNVVLDTVALTEKINSFKSYKEILKYIKHEVPLSIEGKMTSSYLKRFFYTWAGTYKKLLEYDAQNFLYSLTHMMAKGNSHG